MEIKLNLRESLCGWMRLINTIDGKRLEIERSRPTQPGSLDTYPGLGMPFPKRPDQRGKLIVKYAVKYPTLITAAQMASLREAF